MSDFFVIYSYSLHATSLVEKSNTLNLHFCSFDNYAFPPTNIQNNIPKRRMITETGLRTHTSKLSGTTVLDRDSYGTFDALKQIPANMHAINITIDSSCESSQPPFLAFVAKTIQCVKFASQTPIKLSLYSQSSLLPAPFAEIIELIMKAHPASKTPKATCVRKLTFHVNTQYASITKAIEYVSQYNTPDPSIQQNEQGIDILFQNKNPFAISHLKLVFDESPYIRILLEKSKLLFNAIKELPPIMKNLSIHVSGNNSFDAFVSLFDQDIDVQNNGIIEESGVKQQLNDRQQKEGLSGAEETQKKQKYKFFQLEKFSFNLKCIDFIPRGRVFIDFISPCFLSTNPFVKFRVKFPYEVDFNNAQNAHRMKDVFSSYSVIFSDATKITSFYISTSGNKTYIPKQSPQSEWNNIKSIAASQHMKQSSSSQSNGSDRLEDSQMIRSILKKSNMQVDIDLLACVRFLRAQKHLKALSIKCDRPINLEEVSSILQVNSKTLTKFNLRVRNNQYTRNEIDRLLKNVSLVFGLAELTLDIQAVEYVIFKLNGSSVSKLLRYKQGRSVLRATMFTQDVHFECSPVKLFQHFLEFKNLLYFDGKFNGFQFAKDYEKVEQDPSKALQSVKMAQKCEEMFKRMLVARKFLVQLIVLLQTKTDLKKQQIVDLMLQAFVYVPKQETEASSSSQQGGSSPNRAQYDDEYDD